MSAANQLAAAIRVTNANIQSLSNALAQTQQQVLSLISRPRTITEEIDQIPGRRIETVLSGEITFDLNDLGRRGNPIIITVSQDGPFVMTHYPMALWRPTQPTTATNYQRWRPTSSYPLPTQVVSTDIIDIMYELSDGGAQRNFQNSPRGPLLSRPDNVIPAAVPTLWAAASTIQVTPTYNMITFNATPVAPTAGILHFDLIGYRIVNL